MGTGSKLWGHQEHLRTSACSPILGTQRSVGGRQPPRIRETRAAPSPGSQPPPTKLQALPTPGRPWALASPEQERALLRCFGVKLEAGPPRKPPGWKSPLL